MSFAITFSDCLFKLWPILYSKNWISIEFRLSVKNKLKSNDLSIKSFHHHNSAIKLKIYLSESLSNFKAFQFIHILLFNNSFSLKHQNTIKMRVNHFQNSITVNSIQFFLANFRFLTLLFLKCLQRKTTHNSHLLYTSNSEVRLKQLFAASAKTLKISHSLTHQVSLNHA